MLAHRAGWAQEVPVDLTELSLEELMNIEITSASKREEKLFKAAAAVHVITGEDLRRSGVTSIPEALRMAPGMQVARFDANKWAISSRGFNEVFSNKLLVLMDGRSVYTPMFSGVFWESQDLLLEDIERIEVIRGPGATLWGANAVNGVINILTKHAKDTQNGVVTAGLGSEERGFAGVRYAGQLGDRACYRLYAKYFDRDASVRPSGEEAPDAGRVMRGGFRVDGEVSNSDLLTVQGDIYTGDVGETLRLTFLEAPFERIREYEAAIAGGNLLSRWVRTFSDGSDVTLQMYYDRLEREEELLMGGFYHTFDLDLQHRFRWGERQDVVWGTGYRRTSDELHGTSTASFVPDRRTHDLFSFFLQDEIMLAEDRLRVTLGSKFEHNDFTGGEIQPNVRLLWTPNERHTFWGAVSRAVRTPSRADHSMRYVRYVLPEGQLYPDAPLVLVVATGNPEYASEELLAFELGYHLRPTDRLFLDVATFYNLYDNLHTYELGTPVPEPQPAPTHLVLPIVAGNKMYGETYGSELAADWQASERWRLRAAYTYLKMQLYLDGDSTDMFAQGAAGSSPHHRLCLRSSMDLPGDLELDLDFRYVDELPGPDVEPYIAVDARLGWHPLDRLEISVVGQHLGDRHREFAGTSSPFVATEMERGVYGAITWRF